VPAITDTYIRPLYAGNALAKVQAQADARCQVLTIRPTAFAPAPLVVDDSVTVDTMEVKDYDQSVWVSADVSAAGAGRPDLTAAGTVVSGGRGMGAAANFGLLAALADALGNAAVGASRAAVDAGMAPNDQQVGQTGKVVAPDLYVAVGISGAIQHLSGMKDSKVIVAINKDREAPIFQVADYGLVEDLFTAVPALTEQVKS
jgi:electron transfer flavoprotein alpha subunit